MSANVLFNIAALAFSLAAILISILSAWQQAAAARRSNFVTFLADLGKQITSREFQEARKYIITDLSQFDPTLGVYGLPEPACHYVLLVGGFYQDVGSLAAYGVIDEDFAAARHYAGIKEAWEALEPFIRGEREIRRAKGLGNFFGGFEHLAAYTDSVSHEKVRRKFVSRSFPPILASQADPSGSAINSTKAKNDENQQTSRQSGQ